MSYSLLHGLCRAEMEAISRLSPRASAKVIREGAGGDLTKAIDLVAEEAAVAYLLERGFSGVLLSEEIGVKRLAPGCGQKTEPPRRSAPPNVAIPREKSLWSGTSLVLDPIDGTTNAVSGISFYSISVALADGPKLSDVFAGMVVELPSGRVFYAERGSGATLDGKEIRVPEIPSPDLPVGVDMNVKGDRSKLERMSKVLLSAKHLRCMGSAALELCYVASGGLSLYFDSRGMLRVTDIAAAAIIVREAGGSVLGLSGSDLDCKLDLRERASLVAGSRKACEEALALFRGD
uniref:Fructose-bisphosphatase n=1 Tax=Candidatus Methanomethylicus mesodigestus TaxID=1867258 RepID=A0A7C3FAT4_9CREN